MKLLENTETKIQLNRINGFELICPHCFVKIASLAPVSNKYRWFNEDGCFNDGDLLFAFDELQQKNKLIDMARNSYSANYESGCCFNEDCQNEYFSICFSIADFTSDDKFIDKYFNGNYSGQLEYFYLSASCNLNGVDLSWVVRETKTPQGAFHTHILGPWGQELPEALYCPLPFPFDENILALHARGFDDQASILLVHLLAHFQILATQANKKY
jgi:hypothetical protein